ncbi:MAG: hypothetical protein ISR58_00875 [Anaerolineales bacterium]|nr:hypothetical protein [Chloroflexota bacterium]MBL6979717.1 hypothetical protein [Anaerolineales bacterium]
MNLNLKLKSPVSTALAIGVGIVVLLGYFFGNDPSGEATTLGLLRAFLLQGAIVWAGVAMLVGIFNLASVHLAKIRANEEASYSFILLITLIITLGIGLYDIVETFTQQEINFQRTSWIFNYIQLPIETSLMAVLAISLTYAAARLLARRLNLISVVFVGVVLMLLIGAMPQVAAQAPILAEIRQWILRVPTLAGARGILLGIALGTIATGVRILTGSDRPYTG